MKNNIFFIHRGNNDYLKYSIMQAKLYNQDSNIYLIGDEDNNKYDFITHVNIDDYLDSGRIFEKIYNHMSPNNKGYELFCFQRWFILKEFMEKNNILECYYQDSDVLLFTDIFEKEILLHNDFAYCYDSGHSSFYKLNTIIDLCDFITNYYSDINLLNELKKIYKDNYDKGIKQGISDMTLITLFANQNSKSTIDLSKVQSNEIFDHNINCEDGFECIYSKKKIYKMDDNLYCKRNTDNKYIRLNSLHFQGDSKYYMKYFVKRSNANADFSYFDYYNCEWIKDEKISNHSYIKAFVIRLKESIYKFKKYMHI